jgi:hypothetical protein
VSIVPARSKVPRFGSASSVLVALAANLPTSGQPSCQAGGRCAARCSSFDQRENI